MTFITNNLKKIYSYSLLFISILLLSSILYSVSTLLDIGSKDKALKSDYTELHSVQYGLFNSTIWANKIASIVDEKIDEFDFTSTSRVEIKTYIEKMLDTLIVEADRTIREHNKGKRSFFDSIVGSTKQMVTDSLINIKDMRKKVPQFTDAIMNELEKESNQKIIKKIMREKLRKLTDQNLAHTDMTVFNQVLKRYNSKDFDSCNIALDKRLASTEKQMNEGTIHILIMSAILIILVLLQGTLLQSISLFLLSATSVALLVPGIILPMLDIEAKIDKLFFSILDKPLTFTDQILFFQSKSISDLVNLLLDSGETKMIFVGVLLTTFSIIFPSLKLFSSYLYYYSRSFIGNNFVVRFFALKSTKWSMADVMVVSIFMAYLGLDGVVDAELQKVETKAMPINVITTNGTVLEVGFFLFLGFVFTSFVLSLMVEKTVAKRNEEEIKTHNHNTNNSNSNSSKKTPKKTLANKKRGNKRK